MFYDDHDCHTYEYVLENYEIKKCVSLVPLVPQDLFNIQYLR